MKNIIIKHIFTAIVAIMSCSCSDFLDIDEPKNSLAYEQVFSDESTATAAITTLYAKLRDEVLITGNSTGLNVLMGIYADELDYYGSQSTSMGNFYNHQIIASNDAVHAMWANAYNLIYLCNLALEGLNDGNLDQSFKNQLKGETLFIRSLVYFYLTNLWGDIPFVTSTDYNVNQVIQKTPESEVYLLIIEDLILAKSLVSSDFSVPLHIRADKNVVSALLSKVYLYNENWQLAENEATLLIENSALYMLEQNIDLEFLKESSSVIFQLKSKEDGFNTHEAGIFIFETGPPSMVALNPEFVNSFEPNDLRKERWIKTIGQDNESWYLPYKYKIRENSGTSEEYSIIFRLAEQYLIRAEARVYLHNYAGANSDLNAIRYRANLPLLNENSSEDLLTAILSERKAELFTEQGNRWLDLKRWNKASEVLAPIKTNWSDTHLLLPIPQSELLINPNLSPQNPGY